MKIGFIGAGKVGFSFGKYFKENDLCVLGYYSLHESSSILASKFTNTECYKTLNDLVVSCDTLFLTSSDDSLESISSELIKLNIKNKIIVHMSGLKSSDIFKELNNDNYCYSAHPLFSINDKYESYKSLNRATICLEGNNMMLDNIKDLFTSLGNKVMVINKESKSLYHASAVMASNLVNALVYESLRILNDIGFDDSEALLELFINNANNIKNKGPNIALTGPIERNDYQTIKAHLEALNSFDKRIYSMLSLLNINMKDNNEKYKKTIELLKGYVENEGNC